MRWEEIYEHPANKKTIGKNPHLIFPGQVLIIVTGSPAKPTNKEAPAKPAAEATGKRKELLKKWKELPEPKPAWESFKRRSQFQK